MREAFAHDAVVRMSDDHDLGAPGAAITVALCGHWEHEPPCPLAPHHTGAVRDGGDVRLRILFATEPAQESGVRHRIESALAHSHMWQLLTSGPSTVAPTERAHAQRLVTG